MLLISNLFLLLVNAVTFRREFTILFNRVAIFILLYSFIIGHVSCVTCLDNPRVGIYNGLFHSTVITHSFGLSISSSDLVYMFLASSGLYVLSHSIEITKGLRRAGLTYFLFGCLSSSLFLLGSAFLYANCGITSLDPAPILDGLHYSVSTLIYSVAEVDIQPLGSTIGLSHAAILLKNKSIQKDKDPELKDLDPNFVFF